jgi:hypothetical protein
LSSSSPALSTRGRVGDCRRTVTTWLRSVALQEDFPFFFGPFEHQSVFIPLTHSVGCAVFSTEIAIDLPSRDQATPST